MSTVYNKSIEHVFMPENIRRLPVDPVRGYPVPWFVLWIDGKPEFRVADAPKRARAVNGRLCWVCGGPLPKEDMAFVIGPMCALNRISAEPPSHNACAEYSVRACPFLAKPHMARREGGIPEGARSDGLMIERNPGVSLVWGTSSYAVIQDGQGGWLMEIGEPRWLTMWKEGRPATVEEIREAFESGLPILKGECRGRREALEEFSRREADARALLGI